MPKKKKGAGKKPPPEATRSPTAEPGQGSSDRQCKVAKTGRKKLPIKAVRQPRTAAAVPEADGEGLDVGAEGRGQRSEPPGSEVGNLSGVATAGNLRGEVSVEEGEIIAPGAQREGLWEPLVEEQALREEPTSKAPGRPGGWGARGGKRQALGRAGGEPVVGGGKRGRKFVVGAVGRPPAKKRKAQVLFQCSSDENKGGGGGAPVWDTYRFDIFMWIFERSEDYCLPQTLLEAW